MPDLLIEARGPVLVVTFNRPAKKNAVTPEMVVGLADAWKTLRDSDELRVAILTGAGIIPGGGSTVRLARQIPYVEAMRILLTGDPISAEEVRRVGFVNELVPREQLMERAFALAERIASNGPLAVRKIKESVVRSSGVSLEEGYAIEDSVVREVIAPKMREKGRAPSWRSARRGSPGAEASLAALGASGIAG